MKKPTKRQVRAALSEARFELAIRLESMRDELETCDRQDRTTALVTAIDRLSDALNVLEWVANNYKTP